MMALLLLWQLIPSVCLAAGGTADSSFVLAAATAGKVLIEPAAVSYTGSETLAQALKKSGYDLEGLDSGFVTKVQGVSGNYRRVDDAGGLSLDQPAKGVTFLAIVEIDLNAEQAAALGSLLKVMAAYRAFDTGVTRYPPAQEAYKAALEALYRADADASALQAALSGAMDRFDREVVNGKKVTAALTVQTLSGLDPASYTLDTEDSYGRTARFEKSQAIQLVPGAYSFQLQSGSDAQAVGTMTLTDSGVVQIGGETVTTLCLPDGEWLGEAVLHGGSVASGTYDHDGDTYYVADTDPSPYIYLPKGADAGDLSLNAGAVYTNTDGQAVEIPIAWASQAARLTGVLPVGTQAGRVTLKASLAYEGYVLSRLRTLCLERAPTLTALSVVANGAEQMVGTFLPNQLRYTFNVATPQVTITPATLEGDYTVTVQGKKVQPGESCTQSLAMGSNTIEIKVALENGKSRTYTLNIGRVAPKTVTVLHDTDLTYAVGSASVDVSTGTKEVTVPVSLTSNALGLAGAVLALEYDDTALTYTGASAIAPDFTVTPNTAKNTITFDRLDNYTELGEIFSLTFAVKDSAPNGKYEVKLAATENSSSVFLNEDGESTTDITNVSFTPGTITVSGVAAQQQVTSLVLKKTTTDTDLTELKLSISKVGTVYSSSVRAEFEAEEGADTTVTWESSNENVAAVENKVNTSGKNFCRITTKGLGTAIITAHCGDKTASFTLTISAYDSTEMTVASEEGSRYISFTLKSDDTAAPTVQLTTKPKYDLTVLENVQWTSSNENVATVNESGLVTVTGIGSAEISATGTCAGSGTVAKGTASITASPDSSELPTITVKRGDKVISDRSGYNAEELILPIGSTITLKAEQSKTSFTWLGKTYSYKLAANTDWVYSDAGATGTVTVKDNGEIRVTAASYSTAGKKLAIKVYAEGASNSYVYCAFRLIAKTGLTQAEDGYFEIYNANDLKEFADLVNNTACTNAIGGQPEKNLNLRLMNDIDMTSINDTYIPIGSAINGKFGSYASSKYYSWCGDFDGNGHRIYNIDYTAQNRSNVTQWDNSGVIFTTAGSCRDLTVEGKVKTASNWTGALCGVGQCSKYENVISKLEINAGKASSVSGIGGSDQRATFKNCVNYSNIISNSEAKYSYVGGIALEGAVVENCQNYGRLESTNPNAEISGIVRYSRAVGYVIKISQCANYGEIIGAKAAGIVADFEPRGNGSVVDCYNWGEIKGSVYAGGVIGRVDLQAYGNSLKMSGCYNYGSVTSDDSSATLGELIGKISLGSSVPTNSVEKCFYNEDSGNDAIGTIANSSSIVYEAPEFTAISQNDFATLAEKLGENFQNSCPAPVFTWQQAKGHAYGTVVTYVWNLNTETGAYDACTASVECTECGSKLSQALTVEREVARTDCTKERTVTYTATGTINGVAADGTQTDILPAGTHEVNSARWASNGDAHWHVCANCNVRVDETAHTNNGWKTDANNHWHECTVCGSSYDLDKHSGGTATAVKKAQCKACGQEYGELALPTQDKDGYYLIHNADELLWFRNTVNAGQNTIKGRLANDIDMTGACENWVPIGNHYNKYPFKGTFDGAGKTIRNFDVTSAGGSSGFGLFGVAGAKPGYGELAKYTVIKNFTIEGSITSTNTSYGAAVGGVVGDARGYVQVQDVTVDMTIKASGGKVGGIIGSSDEGNVIMDCRNLGNIESSGNSVGGIAGYMRNYGDSVSDCSNEGTVNGKAEVGGIVGFMCGSVSRCINYAEITGTGD